MNWKSKKKTDQKPEKNFEYITDQIKKRQKKIVKQRNKRVSIILKFLQIKNFYLKIFQQFLLQETKYIYFPTGKYLMYRGNKAFDKNVKECIWILCQNCYDIRLEELERRVASQRK